MDLAQTTQAILSNRYFVNEVFSKAFSEFIGGAYINQIADFMENKFTMRIAPRDHFKSTALYEHFLQTSMANAHRDLECHYFSFKQKMAGYHIAKIKKYKAENPEFDQLVDKKIIAEAVIKYTWDGVHFHTLTPHGLLSFKRGIHADIIYVDDPFQDPASKLVTTIIEKINDVVKTQILDMVKRGGQCHIVGTPQTEHDFFFDKEMQRKFTFLCQPAIQDWKAQKVLWPEWMDWPELMARRQLRGEKIFNKEYLCSPSYTEEAYFTREKLMSVVGKQAPVDITKPQELAGEIIAGFDIGKKRHPSHLSVFQVEGDKWTQIFERFFDHADYTKQIDYLTMACENLGIDRLYYDNTRSEFEAFQERGSLPGAMIPVAFTTKSKNAMAAMFDQKVTQKNITLLNKQRFLNQILLVDNDLDAIETPEGHGDSFWSVCLALHDLIEGQPEMTIV